VKSETDRAGRYCASLDEIRARIRVVLAVCDQKVTTGAENLDYEIVALNLRKTLEHIAFGSLTANQAAYRSAYQGIEKVWRAKDLLEKLERIHADFYPKPLAPPTTTGTVPRHHHFEPLKVGFLTRSEFVELYDLCSKVLHSPNPFADHAAINFNMSVGDWTQRIRHLLSFHFFRLAGLPQLWLGELEGPDGRAHVSIALPS